MVNSIPNSKAVACFIRQNSPKGAKCIDADCMQVRGLYIIAWVIEKSISKDQGYYQAICTTYENGNFTLPQSSFPCRYYEDGQQRKITSSSFCSENNERKDLITTQKEQTYTDTYVTLVCSGKPMAQLFIRVNAHER